MTLHFFLIKENMQNMTVIFFRCACSVLAYFLKGPFSVKCKFSPSFRSKYFE